jgi:hypothetical protein
MRAKPRMNGVLAISDQERQLLVALQHLRSNGFSRFEIFTPMPAGELFKAFNSTRGEGESKLRWYTLAGGILGLLGGLALTYGSSQAWPLITGGKPITSFIGFSVIVFETIILIAALSTVMGFFIHGGLFFGAVPGVISLARYSERFSIDTYGLFVVCEQTQMDEVVRALRACSLTEITTEITKK